MSANPFWDEPSEQPQEPMGFVGDLSLGEVHLDQLRQAIFERVERISQVPDLLRKLNETDWERWLSDMRARIAMCRQCHRYVRMAEATTIPELVWLGDQVFCFECAEQVLAEHTFKCEACNHEFHARRPPSPFSICPECDSPGMTFALSSLAAQLQRALRQNLPATLTPHEWLDTLEYFGWRCAYCQRADFACLDHFVPVSQGGGTTRDNCVPACVSCNSTKGGKDPHGSVIKPEAYARVIRYLTQI